MALAEDGRKQALHPEVHVHVVGQGVCALRGDECARDKASTESERLDCSRCA